nr:immunoglobulin light chain junction region [Macaca mulatta]MOW08103.1 immunoglobulin light chain junction region [Macaca mulatta]MOW08298.1 immunoglobulin light chain junction region [Macaca mulatta]MOW10372.1 immunoglobulin light chain junction region [Macaca mulatta]MOW11026.1 immunoglobulin light chain junction region [Macaca mulatta]
CQQGYNMPLTF